MNHFTWLTKAQYKDIDLFPVYEKFVEKYGETGYEQVDINWMNAAFACSEKVKMDLFKQYGYIAAAGDRHLAEFCPGKWYLKDQQTAESWGFGLTPVAWRKELKEERMATSQGFREKTIPLSMRETGEEGVQQIRALCGLRELVTNVNIPNRGQIPNLPIGAVVETNAAFRDNEVIPVMAGEIPESIYPMVSHICVEQESVSEGIAKRDLRTIFNAFANDQLVTCTHVEAKQLFKEMVINTKDYLQMYNLSMLEEI